MAEFDAGISAEEAGIDVADYSDDADVGTVDAVDDSVDDGAGVGDEVDSNDNPWSWVDEKGVTPDVVRDSFENFTKKTQALSKKEQELQPYAELMEELQGDAALQQVIRDYFASGQTPEKEIQNLSSELRAMQTKMQLDSEFSELRSMVKENGLPPFKDEDVLKYAVDEGMPNMAAAYKAMTYDDARAASRAELEKDIKKGKGAAVPKSGRGDNAGQTHLSAQDVANMSEEDFIKGYEGVIKGIVG